MYQSLNKLIPQGYNCNITTCGSYTYVILYRDQNSKQQGLITNYPQANLTGVLGAVVDNSTGKILGKYDFFSTYCGSALISAFNTLVEKLLASNIQ